jgi:hypothetical protein
MRRKAAKPLTSGEFSFFHKPVSTGSGMDWQRGDHMLEKLLRMEKSLSRGREGAF